MITKKDIADQLLAYLQQLVVLTIVDISALSVHFML